ncbi:DUF4169 family protein [Phaeovulum vinaykumarii]|uniref:DUF4169 domain-containing protein n=1 Tax=Phaeovulum vinaykumarii TaxID=407234 RepID=A0A1N7L840_9RHOB|nr:DUF4169 family protein [Phaeovulum vinaykumarii]SIS69986.1 protein of unknown function [Phaeovulum vinaykumarii]SOB99204.1 uncharacterized protein DUF4169 [Phaeovulum vinaykumarii]
MAEVVNLRQARKNRARAEKRARGDENAARFGRDKAERRLSEAQTAMEKARLEAHQREPARSDDGQSAENPRED